MNSILIESYGRLLTHPVYNPHYDRLLSVTIGYIQYSFNFINDNRASLDECLVLLIVELHACSK